MSAFSQFAKRFTQVSGISELMKDLGSGIEHNKKQKDSFVLLGGGNPSHIPSVEAEFQNIWKDLSNRPEVLSNVLGDYSPPEGREDLRNILAKYLSKKLNSNLKPSNIAITNGSQAAFYILLNSLSGNFGKGIQKKILLPLAPDYIGYSNLIQNPNLFISLPPKIKFFNDHEFVYLPDYERIRQTIEKERIGVICFSNPTNPSGNGIQEKDYKIFLKISQQYKIPLLVDLAYGYPFPNILFENHKIYWQPNTILVLSLSKLGLPGLRTGIVVADEEIIHLVREANSILQLAPGNLGQFLLLELLRKKQLDTITKKMIQPFYRKQRMHTLKWIHHYFSQANIPFQYHRNFGAFFLWVGFPELQGNSMDIYIRAKEKGVYIVPGEWFFYGKKEKFNHSKNFIRLTFSRNLSEIEKGIEILSSILKEIGSRNSKSFH